MSIPVVNVVVPSTGDGPIADISGLVGAKTVQLSGTFRGRYVLLGSQDGSHFVPVANFDSNGAESIELTLKLALSAVRVRSEALQPNNVTVNVSGEAGVNQFTTIASIAVGSSGLQPVVDLNVALAPASVTQDLAFLCTGGFQGILSIEGSLDGVEFNPIGAGFRADPRPPSLLASSSLLEFSPLVTDELVRYVRVNLSGPATSPVTVTFGGSNPQSSGPVGNTMDLFVATYTGATLQGLGQSVAPLGATTSLTILLSTVGAGDSTCIAACSSAIDVACTYCIALAGSSIKDTCRSCVAAADTEINDHCAGCVAIGGASGPGGLNIDAGCGNCVALSGSSIGAGCGASAAISFSNIANDCQNCVALAVNYDGGPLTPGIDHNSSFSFSACGSFLGVTSVNTMAFGQSTVGTSCNGCVVLAGSQLGNAGTTSFATGVSTIGNNVAGSFAAGTSAIGNHCTGCVAMANYSSVGATCTYGVAIAAGSIDHDCNNCVALSNGNVLNTTSYSFAACGTTVGSGCVNCIAIANSGGGSGGIDINCGSCIALSNGFVNHTTTYSFAACSSSVGTGCSNSVAIANGSGGGIGDTCGGCLAVCTSTVDHDTILSVALSNSTVGHNCNTSIALCNAHVGDSSTHCFSHSSRINANCLNCVAIALGYSGSGNLIDVSNTNCVAISNSGLGTNGLDNVALAYSFIGNNTTYSFAACGATINASVIGGIAIGNAASSTGTMGMAFGTNATSIGNHVVFGGGTSGDDAINVFTVNGYNGGPMVTFQATVAPGSGQVGLSVTYNSGATTTSQQVLAIALGSLPVGALVLYLSP